MAADGNNDWDLRKKFAEDPEAADLEVFGRKSYPDRRGFLKGAGLATMGAAVGMTIPFHRNIPQGFIPAAMAQGNGLMGKDGLTLLNDRPVNAETPPELLDDAITPTDRHFIRNNGLLPENTNAEGWTLTVDGLVDNPMELSIDDLRSRFEIGRASCRERGEISARQREPVDLWRRGVFGMDWRAPEGCTRSRRRSIECNLYGPLRCRSAPLG